MENGRFKAIVKDYGITQTKAGDPSVSVVFTVKFPDGEKDMTWFGSFKPKAMEITLSALAAISYNGGRLEEGPEGGAIAIGTEASVVVGEEPRQDGSGTWHKIQWVNKAGGSGGSAIKRMDSAQAKAKMASLNLSGEFAAFIAKNPDKLATASSEDADVPF